MQVDVHKFIHRGPNDMESGIGVDFTLPHSGSGMRVIFTPVVASATMLDAPTTKTGIKNIKKMIHNVVIPYIQHRDYDRVFLHFLPEKEKLRNIFLGEEVCVPIQRDVPGVGNIYVLYLGEK